LFWFRRRYRGYPELPGKRIFDAVRQICWMPGMARHISKRNSDSQRFPGRGQVFALSKSSGKIDGFHVLIIATGRLPYLSL